MVAKVKAKAVEMIGRVKAESEEKSRAYTDAITKAKAEAEEKSRDYARAIAEAEAKAKVRTKAKTEKKAKDNAAEKVSNTTENAAKEEPASPAMAENPELNSISALLAICAKDIMQKDIVWGSSDDSVQQALAKMQQHEADYMMIGQDGVPEGIVSKSDLTGAISPYLRPIFAKWRRPLDDATLQIKIKWIMNRPVRTIRPETSLEAVMKDMCQFGGRCLPVVDQQGKVQGLVTVSNILEIRALLKPQSNPNISTVDKVLQVPQLV